MNPRFVPTIPQYLGSSSDKKLKLFFANTRSLVNKLIEFKSFVFENQFDIIMINESWLSDYIPDKSILEKYTIYRKDS